MKLKLFTDITRREDIIIESRLTTDEVQKALADNIEPFPKMFSKKLAGSVSDGSFDCKLVHVRNTTFSTVIEGSYQRSGPGTLVQANIGFDDKSQRHQNILFRTIVIWAALAAPFAVYSLFGGSQIFPDNFMGTIFNSFVMFGILTPFTIPIHIFLRNRIWNSTKKRFKDIPFRRIND
jgi:hypothetical protein